VIVITKRDICIYTTIKGAETIKATQIRLFGVKIAQVCSYAPKLYSYMRKCRLKYLEHALKKRNVHNNGAEWQQSSWQSRRHENVFWTSILNNVVTFRQRKLRKLARKSAQNTAHAHVVAACLRVNRHLHSAVDMTRLTHMRAPQTADKSYSHLWTLWD